MASIVENVTAFIVLIVYLIFAYYIAKCVGSIVDDIKFNRAKKSFFRKLQNKMKQGIIKNLEDVTLVQDSIAKTRKFYPLASRNIDSLLVEYLDHLSDRDKKGFRLVKSLIIQARAEKPLFISQAEIVTKLYRGFGGWAISKELFNLIRAILPRGKTLLELGSGWTSQQFSQYYRPAPHQSQK